MKYIFSLFFGFSLLFSQGDAFGLDDAVKSMCSGVSEESCKSLICEKEMTGLGSKYKIKLIPGIDRGAFCDGTEDEDSSSVAIVNQIWRIINVISMLAGGIAILMISISGFRMITSLGGEDLEKAKQGLTWSLVALLLIVFSYVLIFTFINSIYEIGGPTQTIKDAESQGFVGDGTDM